MTTEPIEATPTEAIAVREHQPVGLFGTTEPTAIIEKASAVATALKGVIVKQKLVSNIQGKQYPRCEAWTLLGTMLGVFPVMEWTKPIEGGWECRVEARTRDGAVLGAAESQCLRTERNWADRDDFALRSMAQTRATAKALRMPLGFVMTLAGYEATPAEEMVFDKTGASGRNAREEEPGNGYTENLGAGVGTGRASTKPDKQPVTEPAAAATRTDSVAREHASAMTDAERKEQRAVEQKTEGTFPTATTRQWMIEQLQAGLGGKCRDVATEFMRKAGLLLPTEQIEDLPLGWVPSSKRQLSLLEAALNDFADGEEAKRPYARNLPPDEKKGKKEYQLKTGTGKPASVPTVPRDAATGSWRDFPVPFGKNAGTSLGKLSDSSLAWYVNSFEVSFEYNGRPKKPETIAKDKRFREALDAAKAELGIEAGDQPQ